MITHEECIKVGIHAVRPAPPLLGSVLTTSDGARMGLQANFHAGHDLQGSVIALGLDMNKELKYNNNNSVRVGCHLIGQDKQSTDYHNFKVSHSFTSSILNENRPIK